MKEYRLRVEVEPLEYDKENQIVLPIDDAGNQIRGFAMHERFYRFVNEEPQKSQDKHKLWYFEHLASNLVSGKENTEVGGSSFEVLIREFDQ